MKGYVYILASQKNGTLYTGVTRDLARRIMEHKSKGGSAFTSEHSVKRLVYFEIYDLLIDAVAREKKIKKWNRQWKINLIEKANPHWNELRCSSLPYE